MGDSTNYHSEGDNRAPRKNRSHQKNEQRSPQDKTDRSRSYDEDRRSNQHYNERGESRNQQRSQTRDQYHRERAPKERSRNSDYERDQYHEERKHQQSNHRERSHNQYKERDQYVEDKAQHRNQHGASGDWYKEREKYYEEKAPSRNQHEMSRYHEREGHRENHLYTVDQLAKNRENDFNYKVERSFSPHGSRVDDMEYYEPESDGGILDCHKCRYLCTGRGILQVLEVVLNALVLICLISSYFVLSGFSAGLSGGGFGNTNYPFEGQELKDVRQLDQQFTFMRAPLLYGGLAVSVLMGSITLGVAAAGAKHLLSLTGAWLLAEAIFSTLASLGYCAAVGVFLHFALQINSTDVCKKRERLYARNGLTWMNCDLAGTDGGVATFGILLVILYGASVVLAVRAYRERKLLQREFDDRRRDPDYVR